jgi:hypothetical protein
MVNMFIFRLLIFYKIRFVLAKVPVVARTFLKVNCTALMKSLLFPTSYITNKPLLKACNCVYMRLMMYVHLCMVINYVRVFELFWVNTNKWR